MGTLKDNFVLAPREYAQAYFDAYLAYELCVPMDTLFRSCHLSKSFYTKANMTSADMMPECMLTHWVRHVQRIPEVPLAERGKRNQVQYRMLRGDGSFRLLGGHRRSFLAYW